MVSILILILVRAILVAAAKVSVVLLIAALVSVALVHLGTAGLGLNILLDQINDFIWNAEILDGAASNVAFVHAPELVAVLQMNCVVSETTGGDKSMVYLGCADDFTQVDVHPCVAAYQVTIVRFAILQLDQLKSIKRRNCLHRRISETNFRIFLPSDAIEQFSKAIVEAAGRS